MRVAVLGGTISGVTAARQISHSGARVELFRNLNDPKRNINSLHPICEYQASTFVLRDDAPKEFADEVQLWQNLGFVQPAPSFRRACIDAQGQAQRTETNGRRFAPRGGFFVLIDKLVEQLAGSVDIRAQQLERMSRDKAGKWWLQDRAGKDFGPYDVVLFAFDALPRAVRKASQKQLLESALPHSAGVIAASARSQVCSSMVVVLHFDPPIEVPYDYVAFEGIPELQFATRNPKEHQAYRGIREKHDTWTVVATPAWSLSQRPCGKSNGVNWQGKWDKAKVGKRITSAFGHALGIDVNTGRQIIPTFHWEGCSYISQVQQGSPCAFDSEAGIGWCGDMFGGMGPSGAVVSGLSVSSIVADLIAGNPRSVLPGELDWGLRPHQPDDEDIVSIVGLATGRHDELHDGLDHTWQTAVQCAMGEQVHHADSYRGQRRQGAMGDRHDFRNKDGPWTASSASDTGNSPGCKAWNLPRLRCQRVDDGILKVTGIPLPAQAALLQAVFPTGARGVCGGLYDNRRGTIDVGHGETWSRGGSYEAPWTELGMHGSHTVDWGAVEGDIVNQVLMAVKRSAQDILGTFNPDCVRVSFENMRARTIDRGQTLCGWSFDRERVDKHDGAPKVCVLLGNSEIQYGYKYAKEDRESLDVELCPGDVLIVHGPARAWCSAINGFKHRSGSSPFDFAHVWLLDHRRLQQAKPQVHASIHQPPTPAPGGAEYKWMQFTYTVRGIDQARGDVRMEVSDGQPSSTSMPQAEQTQSASHRRDSKAASSSTCYEAVPKQAGSSTCPDAHGRRWGPKLRSREAENS